MIRSDGVPFHGVVPGVQAIPLGQVDLPITFGGCDNFRMEVHTFEVADFPGTYHVILGWPCYAKFMAIPNYTHLKLKFLGPQGITTMSGDIHQAHLCEQENCNIAMAVCTSTEPGGTWVTMT